VPKLTPNTLTGDSLRTQLEEIRASEVSVNREESTVGLAGAAVPVRDANGSVVAGLAVHAPVTRFGEAEITASIPLLRKAAEELTQDFVFRN
ncbi:MAG: IclR family transcriptional regulator C-terminal domain-containing protein, partial [Pseudomonadota bacterium]